MLNQKKSAISRATQVCIAVANGDFEARILDITEKGQLGELMHSINLLVDRTDAYLRESKACMEYVARNQHFRLIAEKGMVGAFQSAAQSINTATYKAQQRHDSFCEMSDSLDTKLEDIVTNVSSTISALQTSSKEVSTASKSAQEQALRVASGAEEASSNMQNVAAAAEELTSSIGEINRQVVTSAGVAKQSVEKSQEISKDIKELAEASKQIGDVVSLISDITAQTNLLALNATIEAARAGEAGRGFAVVAQEVKTLAAQTANATVQITEQITTLQDSTGRAVIANEEISKTVAKISEVSISIAAAVEEQSTATQEIANNVEEAALGTVEISQGITSVNEATQVTESTASEVLQVSEMLVEQENNLVHLRQEVSDFIVEVKRVG
ncbi:MAG: methyl-accepting chemotaxis protein [Alphaproteobacteria bacterium]|nr:methyl-accepting chemotaxis protein [Alphaproteobacteria bacterium]